MVGGESTKGTLGGNVIITVIISTTITIIIITLFIFYYYCYYYYFVLFANYFHILSYLSPLQFCCFQGTTMEIKHLAFLCYPCHQN